MRRVSISLIALAAIAMPIVAVGRAALHAAPDLPDGKFRVTVDEVIKDDETLVCRVVIEPHFGAAVSVVPSVPDRGGFRSGAPKQLRDDGSVPVTRLTIFGAQVGPGGAQPDALKFSLRREDWTGSGQMSISRPMPAGRANLSQILSMTLKTGDYPEGMLIPLVTYDGTVYNLIVERPEQ